MNNNNIYGSLKNFKFEIYNFEKNNFIDDNEITIAIDGENSDKQYLKKIKKQYLKQGEEFVKNIDDLQSIYLYDKRKNILLLIRDRIGLKQIYYCKEENIIYFGKDIMEIVKKNNLKKDINKNVLSMYFRYHYIIPPDTIFKNIYKLEQGSYLIYKNNKTEIKKYWDVIEKYNNKKIIKNYEETKEKLEKKLENYIKQKVQSKKNIGVYLSGGIDSSLVAALYQKYSKKPIDTFSIGFYEKEKNEAEKAKKIGEFLGTNHHEIYIDEKKALETINKITDYYTEPFADPSELPTIVLNEYAKKNNIEKALTGDGADQLFCGSSIYDTLFKIQKAHAILNPLNITIKNKKINKNRKLSYIYTRVDKKYKAQHDMIRVDNILKKLLDDYGKKRYYQEANIECKNWQERRMILDLNTFIPDRVIRKMELSASKNNIHVNSPFLDTKIIEYTFQIPHKFKYYRKNKKYILKQILYKYVPKELLEDKKKGFGIPKKKWLKTILYEELIRLSKKDYLIKQKIFNYNFVNDLIKQIDNDEITNILWDYLVFQLWYEKYINIIN